MRVTTLRDTFDVPGNKAIDPKAEGAVKTERKLDLLGRLGSGIIRYGLVLLLLAFGYFKFFNFEAEGIRPLVANNPLMAWLYEVFSVKGTSILIGSVEIGIGALVALRPWFPKVSAYGSAFAAIMFLVSLSFLVTTPGMWVTVEGIIVPSDGGFILKDIVLLGGSVWTAVEAWNAKS